MDVEHFNNYIFKVYFCRKKKTVVKNDQSISAPSNFELKPGYVQIKVSKAYFIHPEIEISFRKNEVLFW